MDVLPSVYSEANFEPHDEVTKLTSPKLRLTGNVPRKVKFLSRQDRNKQVQLQRDMTDIVRNIVTYFYSFDPLVQIK